MSSITKVTSIVNRETNMCLYLFSIFTYQLFVNCWEKRYMYKSRGLCFWENEPWVWMNSLFTYFVIVLPLACAGSENMFYYYLTRKTHLYYRLYMAKLMHKEKSISEAQHYNLALRYFLLRHKSTRLLAIWQFYHRRTFIAALIEVIYGLSCFEF